MISQALEFHTKFDLPLGDKDKLSHCGETVDYRLNFLQEELDELQEALLFNRDRIKAFAALLDLVYVAHGTALFMGISPEQWQAGMDVVHAANMSKVRVVTPTQSKRGTALDVVKPVGWVAPEVRLKEIFLDES